VATIGRKSLTTSESDSDAGRGGARRPPFRRRAASVVSCREAFPLISPPTPPAARWHTTRRRPPTSGTRLATTTSPRTSLRTRRNRGASAVDDPRFSAAAQGATSARFATAATSPSDSTGHVRSLRWRAPSTGCVVLQQDFLALDLPAARFDGVFANASLFHVPSHELPRVTAQLRCALRPRGCSSPRTHAARTGRMAGGRYGVWHDLAGWRATARPQAFVEVRHFYRPPDARGGISPGWPRCGARGRRFGNYRGVNPRIARSTGCDGSSTDDPGPHGGPSSARPWQGGGRRGPGRLRGPHLRPPEPLPMDSRPPSKRTLPTRNYRPQDKARGSVFLESAYRARHTEANQG